MTVTRFFFFSILLTFSAALLSAKPDRHKTEEGIARMTPEQRVNEYCDEYYHHSFLHDEYIDMISKYILQDGIKAAPALAKIINEYDPTKPKGKSREKNARAYAAEGMLSQLDTRVVRLRGSEEGRAAIDAMSRLVQRMRAAHLDTDVGEGETSPQARYGSANSVLENLRGINHFDRAIRDTLELRHKIKLRDKDMLDFANYLISKDPNYPRWSTLKRYKDYADRNEAGNPLQYVIVENIEPYYKEYLKFKGKS